MKTRLLLIVLIPMILSSCIGLDKCNYWVTPGLCKVKKMSPEERERTYKELKLKNERFEQEKREKEKMKINRESTNKNNGDQSLAIRDLHWDNLSL